MSVPPPVAVPLAGAADMMLRRLAAVTRAPAIAALTGAGLLTERAALTGFRVPGPRVAAGGGCRLLDARDGAVALNLARDDDRALLPALLEDDRLDGADDASVAAAVADRSAMPLVARGREMGLAIAALSERASAVALPPEGDLMSRPPRAPRVLDLTALWAGPLATRLLGLAGATVVKVESRSRPDALRGGQPGFHDLLNRGKRAVALDLASPDGHAALLRLIDGADIVVEASRPRALLQLGIDADAILATRPDLTWLSITAHGLRGDAANWVGFGDDVGVAAGLSAALHRATGALGFVGDAIADPLTGIAAALAGWTAYAGRRGGRHGIAMVSVAAAALAWQRDTDATRLEAELRGWVAAAGHPIAPSLAPPPPAQRFGVDPPDWPPC